MGFIASASTVTVEAKLTDDGRKKLYKSIEGDSNGFITKFTMGDSDSNYAAIVAGTPTLESGHVPETSDFKPNIRSFILYSGKYRPGIPVILINDNYAPDNGLSNSISIGANTVTRLDFGLKTEWPKNSLFMEDYKIILQNPGNMSEVAFSSIFTITKNADGNYSFVFNGASQSDLDVLIGESKIGETTIPIKIIGKSTNQITLYNIEVKQ